MIMLSSLSSLRTAVTSNFLRSPLTKTSGRTAIFKPITLLNIFENKQKTAPLITSRVDNRPLNFFASRNYSTIRLEPLTAIHNELNHEIKLATHLQAIAKRSRESLNGYAENPSFLDTGMWYPSDLFMALTKTQQTGKINLLMEKDAFYYGYANPEFFEPVKEQGGVERGRCAFQVKDGVPAADALKEIRTGFTICDCTMAYSIAFYETLLDILGEEKFNRLFQGHFRMVLGQSLTFCTPENLLCEHRNGSPFIKKGKRFYFEGVQYFHDKHLFSPWGGIHVVCIDDTANRQLFTGFGLDPEGETAEQIIQKLLEAYNEPADLTMGLSKELLDKFSIKIVYAQMCLDHQVTRERVIGLSASAPSDFKIDLINALIKASPEQVSSNFVVNTIIPKKVNSVWSGMSVWGI